METAGLQIPDEIAALNDDLGCDAYLYQGGDIYARIDVGSGLDRESGNQ